MPNPLPLPPYNFRLRLAHEGPLLGWTRLSADNASVVARIFATPDDSESDPAVGLIVSYVDSTATRRFIDMTVARHPLDIDGRAPFFASDITVPASAFSEGVLELEVLTLHAIYPGGGVFSAPQAAFLTATAAQPSVFTLSTGGSFDYAALRSTLAERLDANRAMLHAPNPTSHSFERRSDRSLDEARVVLRMPSMTAFSLVATTCRYPGFAFESERVDAASFTQIAARHADSSALLLLGDQIYADATASLFDKLTSLEKYQERYHALFRSPGFAAAVRAMPCYMTGDDHEYKDAWAIPDQTLQVDLFKAARMSFDIYQMSHSPAVAPLGAETHDYSFIAGPVAVYVMDTISKRNTTTPGAETIVSDQQLAEFRAWLGKQTLHHILLATGGVVAPGMAAALDGNHTDVHRAQGWDNWQAFNAQRLTLLDIIAASGKNLLLVSGDYHCAAIASIKTKTNGQEIAKAVVVPPAYAPMRYVNATASMLAVTELTGAYEITLDSQRSIDGSGFAVIELTNGLWDIRFETAAVADA